MSLSKPGNTSFAGWERCRFASGHLMRKGALSVLIPDPAEPDSRRRFPNRREYDSPWQARGGLPWRQRFGFGEFRISISKQTLSRELRALGFRKLSARPRHHAQDAEALVAFKKSSPPASTRSPSVTRQASR